MSVKQATRLKRLLNIVSPLDYYSCFTAAGQSVVSSNRLTAAACSPDPVLE